MPVKPIFDPAGGIVGAEITPVDGANVTKAAYDANRAELDALAIQARDLARGTVPMPSTVAARDALLKKLCEAFARMWFNERFGDE
jgi:hypothetical protein